ncbi:hypothetical protein D3C77_301060 [compost metagenome]
MLVHVGTLKESIVSAIAWERTTGRAILPVVGMRSQIPSPSTLGLDTLRVVYSQQLEQVRKFL